MSPWRLWWGILPDLPLGLFWINMEQGSLCQLFVFMPHFKNIDLTAPKLCKNRMFRHFGTKLFSRKEDHDPTKQCSSLIVNLSLTLSWSKKLLEIDRRKTRQTDTSLKHLWTITATFSSQEGNMLQLNYWAYIPAWGELSRTRTCHCFSSELRDSVFKLCIWLHFNFNGTPPKSVING